MAKVVIDKNGTKIYYNANDGRSHREDGPAVIWPNGQKGYYLDGLIVRNTYADGETYWYNVSLSRDSQPAMDFPNGFKRWCHDGIYIWPELL